MSEYDDYEVQTFSIDENNIELEMRRVPADFAYLNARLVEATAERDEAKVFSKATEARVYLAVRQAYEVDPTRPKFTEKTIESRVAVDPDVIRAQKALIEAEANFARAKGLCDAVKLKSDSLTSIGMRINAEIRSNPLAAAQARGDRLNQRG